LRAQAKAVVKAVKTAAKKTSETINLTAKTWKADFTQVLISTFFVHEKTFANVIERITTTDSATKRSVVKTGSIIIRGSRGSVARDVEFAQDGAIRFVIYSAGGIRSGWFMESDVAVAGLTFEHFANAEALAKSLKFSNVRRNAGSSSEYTADMENDLSKAVYSASVRRVNGRLISWHEEDKRNSYNAHEVSAAVKEAKAHSALNGAKTRGNKKAVTA
jgi:hypothetical protein